MIVGDDLCDWSAVSLRQALDRKEITSAEIVESCIARIDSRNPDLNAIVTTDFDRARSTASKLDQTPKESPRSAVYGLPIVIKDLNETEGLRTTFGSRMYADYVPEKDDAIVARLIKSGAIVLGKTNTPEFGAGANTTNEVFGATRNPFDMSLTSGGSSGGAAVAVATGMAPLATGSDFGGSLRIPAAFCGVVGFRASPGWVAAPHRTIGYSPLWIEGPIARSVEDAALLFNTLSGFGHGDPLSHPILPRECTGEERRDFWIAFTTDLGATEIDTKIAGAFESACNSIKTIFPNSDYLDLDLSAAHDLFSLLRAEDMVANHGERVRTKPELIGHNIRNNVTEATAYTFEQLAVARANHTSFEQEFQRLFDGVDALICPTCAIPPFPVEQNHPTEINGKSLDRYYSWYALTYALSLSSSPVISLPAGKDADGLPFGIQIIMRRNRDLDLIKIATLIEAIDF